jgi:hypothetical protein
MPRLSQRSHGDHQTMTSVIVGCIAQMMRDMYEASLYIFIKKASLYCAVLLLNIILQINITNFQ